MNEPEGRNRPRLAGLIAIGLVVVIGLGIIASLSLDDGKADPINIDGAGDVRQLVGGIPQLGPRLGQDDAPVTIELFSDVQCEECADYQAEVIDPLIADEVRGGDVKLIFRHYSMDEDRVTGVGGFASVSASLQDQEWAYLELFMRNQGEIENNIISQEFMDQVANGVLNLNVEQWQRDFNDDEITEILEADEKLAVQRRLPLEPAVVVNGDGGSRELIEKPSLEEIREAIDEVKAGS